MSREADWSGSLTGIFIAPDKGEPMQDLDSVAAIPGLGLEGDRYALQKGSLSRWSPSKRQVTLISVEALDALASETGVQLAPIESRRNLLVHGVPLNDMLGCRFRIGDVQLEGVRLCQPCKYLERKSGLALLPAMIGKGGLRAQVLSEGILRVGDVVVPI